MTTALSTLRPSSRSTTMLAKVPAVTAVFWVVKLLTTGMGEALADFGGEQHPVLLGVLGSTGFVAAMTWQLRSREYRAVPYWCAVSMVAVVGTVAADGVKIALGLSLPEVTTFYAVALAAVLAYWFRSEGTLSVHSITTRRREALYWTTVMLSFALGTAAGDLTAFYLGWGFVVSIVVFGLAMLVPLALHRAHLLGEVAAFWSAYVLTRPLGASVADWLGKPMGVGLGDGTVATAAIALIAVLVAYLAVSRRDVQAPEVAAPR
jgi:uncharacterized membrane-anchored protein